MVKEFAARELEPGDVVEVRTQGNGGHGDGSFFTVRVLGVSETHQPNNQQVRVTRLASNASGSLGGGTQVRRKT